MTKRRACKRKRIQQGGKIEYGEVAAQGAAEASVAAQPSKKTRGAGGLRLGTTLEMLAPCLIVTKS
ncbi:hypothetical protein BU25DRAFT_406365 [Macroventuria anomochaeta]|uniref:Uncharacterized protein n=1 Tax=Macroventuria anomochaeta TaxID=301207 RepID=A0ACB6SFL1_9PLEO|nr:uncharacterized protein BU25DRAFT_406365 [Macroventuria anomochaeta]KAF2633111.1 hypothetical protein BU25DRAFT_406365 [Macroventuria anomochaeta]